MITIKNNLNNQISKYIRIKQIKSCIGQSKKNKLLIKGLGLKGINKEVILKDSRAVRGIIFKIQHLILIFPH